MRFRRPRQHHVLVFVALALAGASCGGGGRSTYVSVPWSIYDVADVNMTTPLDCSHVGAGDVVVTATNSATNQAYTSTFSCASYTSRTSVPAGTYTVTVTLYAAPSVYGNNTTVIDQYAWTQTVGSGPNAIGTVALFVNSYVLRWTTASSCAALGAAWVALDIYYSGQNEPTSYFLKCASGSEATQALPLGTFPMQWQAFLVDAAYKNLTPGTPLVPYTVRNEDPGRVQADLGTVHFPY